MRVVGESECEIYMTATGVKERKSYTVRGECESYKIMRERTRELPGECGLEVRVIHNSKCMMSDGTCSFMSGNVSSVRPKHGAGHCVGEVEHVLQK